jgi:hypothetical protein
MSAPGGGAGVIASGRTAKLANEVQRLGAGRVPALDSPGLG